MESRDFCYARYWGTWQVRHHLMAMNGHSLTLYSEKHMGLFCLKEESLEDFWTLFTTALGIHLSKETSKLPQEQKEHLHLRESAVALIFLWMAPWILTWSNWTSYPESLPSGLGLGVRVRVSTPCGLLVLRIMPTAFRGQDTPSWPAAWDMPARKQNQQFRQTGSGILKMPESKTWYLLNMALRNLFPLKVLIHKQKSTDVAHSSIEHFTWSMGINLI